MMTRGSRLKLLFIFTYLHISMEGALDKQVFSHGTQLYTRKRASRNLNGGPQASPQQKSRFITQCLTFSVHPKFPMVAMQQRNASKIWASRRRRSNTETDTYVLMEPGKSEEFVTEDELRERLKSWLQNWPGTSLPPDLARFESFDDAVSYLVKSVCELEIDGDVGSIQWYEVSLE